ncbi:MAG TPA: transposase [Paenibacillaceae bacterium]|nr:transposase [Paenibacillaceae bacterium]
MYLKILIYLLPLVFPVIMLWSITWFRGIETLYNFLAFVSLYLFSVTVALYVMDTILEGKIYNTTIHGILLNPFFLIPGGYFGMYSLYQLLRLTFKSRSST